jgi:hypothetical protein
MKRAACEFMFHDTLKNNKLQNAFLPSRKRKQLYEYKFFDDRMTACFFSCRTCQKIMIITATTRQYFSYQSSSL